MLTTLFLGTLLVATWKTEANEVLRDDKVFDKCKIGNHQKKFDVLPGRGWDNLQNKDMGRILNLNFSKCSFSEDNKFLIPNEVGITPLKMSALQMFSETFEHFNNYTSTTSKSVNVEVSGHFHFFSASGSYSHEHETVKNDQLYTKSTLTRVQLRYKVYESIFEPDSPLEPVFRDRIMDIASILVEGNDDIYPAYLADLIVRDFGTHVIRAIDAGAVLSKVDALDKKYVKKYQSESDGTTVSASASASFGAVFGVSVKASYNTRTTQVQLDEYTKSCVKTHVFTHGGGLFRANFSLDQWESTVQDNLVPIDRTGDPIYYVITHRSLPELDRKTLRTIFNLLKDAIKRYYDANVIIGCMDVDSPNFNHDANVDSGYCQPPTVNFTLGGLYQTCTGDAGQCQSVQQQNPLTGTYSCPRGFTAVHITGGLNRCEKHCHGWWLWRRCDTSCSNFATFWCHPISANAANHNGYQFGGILSYYGGKHKKPSCPMGYIPLKIGLSAQICVTNDADPNNPYAIQFGGFYSCSVGNPLAQEYNAVALKGSDGSLQAVPMMSISHWPKSCGKGYVAHILTVERGCQISYCTKTNSISFGNLPPLHRPPFISLDYNPNTTKPLIFSSENGNLMVKDSDGTWQLKDIRERQNHIVVGSVVGSIALALLVSGLVFFLQRRFYQKKIRSQNMLINEDDGHVNNTYGSVDNFADGASATHRDV